MCTLSLLLSFFSFLLHSSIFVSSDSHLLESANSLVLIFPLKFLYSQNNSITMDMDTSQNWLPFSLSNPSPYLLHHFSSTPQHGSNQLSLSLSIFYFDSSQNDQRRSFGCCRGAWGGGGRDGTQVGGLFGRQRWAVAVHRRRSGVQRDLRGLWFENDSCWVPARRFCGGAGDGCSEGGGAGGGGEEGGRYVRTADFYLPWRYQVNK